MSHDRMLRNLCTVLRMPAASSDRNGFGERATKPRVVVVQGDDPETPCYWTYTGGNTTITIGGTTTSVEYRVNLSREAAVRAGDLIDLDNGVRVRIVSVGEAAGGSHKVAQCTTALR